MIDSIGLVEAVEQAMDGVVITDAGGRIQYVNPAFTAMTGYSSEEVLGHYPRVLKSGHHSDDFYSELWSSIKSKGTQVRVITVGKKALGYFRFRGIEVERTFQGFADKPQFSDARDIAQALAAPFVSGEADQVLIVSTHFKSAASQVVETRQLLPLTLPDAAPSNEVPSLKGYTEFEPEVEQLLAELAPKALESEVFTALLEGAASFHTSQQRAMAAATDNADELGRTLTRIMNRARQDSITTEIMEIVGGAEALRSGK